MHLTDFKFVVSLVSLKNLSKMNTSLDTNIPYSISATLHSKVNICILEHIEQNHTILLKFSISLMSCSKSSYYEL